MSLRENDIRLIFRRDDNDSTDDVYRRWERENCDAVCYDTTELDGSD